MMEWQQLIADGCGRVLELLEKALEGLTQDDLNEQPHLDSNSMGWLTWHITRVQDHQIAGLMGEEQLRVRDRWHARFNRGPTPQMLALATVRKMWRRLGHLSAKCL